MEKFTDLYNSNPVMTMIGLSDYYVHFDKNDIEAIMSAYENDDKIHSVLEVGLDFAVLGYIYGKKSERAKRNRKAVKSISDDYYQFKVRKTAHSINDRINEYLKQNSIGVVALADMCDLNDNEIREVITPGAKIGAVTYYKLVKGLGVDYSTFIQE